MPIAVLNVRRSRQKSMQTVRIDNRNKELAIQSIGRKVLLYAPRDEKQHGYFGSAEIAQVNLDAAHKRFMFVELAHVETFARPLPLEHIPEPLESLGYRKDGRVAFGHFSAGIRRLTGVDRNTIGRLEAALKTPRGFEAPQQTGFETPLPPEPPRRHVTRTMAVRNARLRWTVLEHYGSACAVCRSNFGDTERGLYEVEVCHLQPLRLGGPDAIANAMPMCRTHHWAFDAGLFTILPQGQILVSNRMTPDLRTRFNGHNRAFLPELPRIRPAPEYMLFHQAHVFQP